MMMMMRRRRRSRGTPSCASQAFVFNPALSRNLIAGLMHKKKVIGFLWGQTAGKAAKQIGPHFWAHA